MLRISLFVASLSACAFNDQGQVIICTENNCEIDTDEPSGPVPPPPPVSFAFENGEHHGFHEGLTLARGGVLHLDVVSTLAQIPVVTGSGTLELETVSAETQLTTVDVVGAAVGAGTISAKTPGVAAVTLNVSVKELAKLDIGLPYDTETRADHILVLPDIRTLALTPIAEDGTAVLDHSFALVDPPVGFALASWDALSIPQTAGDYRLGLTRATGDVLEVGVRVLDHVDDIVAIDFDDAGKGNGTLCVKAVADGEEVRTYAWAMSGIGADVYQSGSCASFYAATPGATITVELAGMTKVFAL